MRWLTSQAEYLGCCAAGLGVGKAAAVGDLNNDGIDDLVFSASQENSFAKDKVYVVFGAPGNANGNRNAGGPESEPNGNANGNGNGSGNGKAKGKK